MKRAISSSALAASFLLLAACQPQAPDGGPAPPPADAPTDPATPTAAVTAAPPNTAMDISQPIRAVGTEPFWNLTIDGATFTLERPDKPVLTASAPGAALRGDQAVWIAKTSDGRQMTVTLRASDCSDGMSDTKYPLAAEVALLNETLYGCAAKAADLPRGK